MRSDLFYSSAFTRALLVFLQKAGMFRLASWFLKTRASRFLIPGFIKKVST